MTPDELLILRGLAWFKLLDPINKARLGSAVEIIYMKAGEFLHQQDQPKHHINYLVDGCISEKDDNFNLLQTDTSEKGLWDISKLSKSNKINQGFLSSEVINLKNPLYESTAICELDSMLLRIDLAIFDDLMKKLPDLKQKILVSLVLKDQSIFESDEGAAQKEKTVDKSLWKLWILVIIVPLISCALIKNVSPELSLDQLTFIGIVVAALTLWITEIVPLFAPALLILSGLSVIAIAPADVVLSGFGSQTFLFMIGLYTIGSLIKESGLAFRICLNILLWIPAQQEYIASALFGIGLLLNPILPSATARSNIVSALLVDIKQNLRIPDRSQLYSGFALSVYTGITTFSFVFLTAKSENLILYALLPLQTRDGFGYLSWFMSSLVIAIPLFILMSIIWRVRFSNCQSLRITKDIIKDQLFLLGNLSNSEIQAIVCIFLFFLGSMTSAIHGISMAWISVLILCYLVFSKVVNNKNFKSFIDWQFLLFLAAIIGLSNSIPYSGFDSTLLHSLSGLKAFAATNMYGFTMIISILIFSLRLILPPKLCAPLLATIFIPMFQSEGLNSWYFCIICLVLCDSAFLPYQHATLASFLSEIDANTTLNKKTFFQINSLINLCKIVAILIAIFVWQKGGAL